MPRPTSQDLAGYWDMLQLSVQNVSMKFDQGTFRPSGRNRGLPLSRRGGQGPHLAKRWEPRGFSRVAAGFSRYDGDLALQ